MPGPAEHETMARHEFAIDAADLVLLAALAGEVDAVAAPDSEVDRGRDRGLVCLARPKPARYSLWVRPRAVHLGGRRFEPSLEGEAWFAEHSPSCKKVARRSSLSVQKRP